MSDERDDEFTEEYREHEYTDEYTAEHSYTQEFDELVKEDEPVPEPQDPYPAEQDEEQQEAWHGPKPGREAEDVGPPGQDDQPTEEVFALEAKLINEEDVPELDPMFREALLANEAGNQDDEQQQPTHGSAPGREAEDGEPTGHSPGREAEDVGPLDDEEPEEPDSVDESFPETGETGEWDEEQQPAEHGQAPAGEAEDGAPLDEDVPDSTAERTAILASEARREVHAALAQARDAGVGWDPNRPPSAGDPEPPASRKRYWWRFALASLLIVFSFAGATYASVQLTVDDVFDRVGRGEKIGGLDTVPPSEGGARTIVILGSDVRKGDTEAGRSDTTMLLRLDPERNLISMLSIPRDLEVDIPGYGIDKFNAAYSYGGAKLTLDTIKSLTGLQVNHVINIDFQGFAEAVDAIDCVFVDVDRDYFNDNAGLSYSEQYATIDIDAGYQKLCGPDALDFVRYRHTDTDLVRSARQQDFLREARLRVPATELWSNRNELIDILTEYTKTDPRFTEESNLLDMAKLMIELRGTEVNKVEFPATLGPSFVYSTPDQIHEAVTQFLGYDPDQADSATVTGDVPGSAVEGTEKKQRKQEQANQAKEKKKERQDDGPKPPAPEDDGLVDAAVGGRDVANGLASESGRNFPIFYPRRLPSGTIYSEGTRMYHMRDPDKNPHSAYRIVLLLQLSDGDHWFGVQGIRGWTDPPILSAPHEEIEMGGRVYGVYYQGSNVRLVSWESDGNVYWISNSLGQTLSNDQMIGMARSIDYVTPDGKGKGR